MKLSRNYDIFFKVKNIANKPNRQGKSNQSKKIIEMRKAKVILKWSCRHGKSEVNLLGKMDFSWSTNRKFS